MGHVVNPMGFRLGFLDSWLWSDFWCVKHLYYSEFLYSTYSISEELHSVLHGESFGSLGCLYSHFCIYKSYNKFFIYIFVYDGPIEEWMDKNLGEVLLEESEKMSNSKFQLFSESHAAVSGAMSCFFNIFVGNMCYYKPKAYGWSRSRVWRYQIADNRVFAKPSLSPSFEESELTMSSEKSVLWDVNPFKLNKFSKRFQGISLILWDSLLPNWKSIFLFKVIFGSGFMSGLRLHALMGVQEPYYGYLSYCLSDGWLDKFSLLKTKVLFLGLRNSEVTSFMMTSFMGVKLSHRYTVWELITPLRRELSFLRQLGSGHLLGYKFHFCGRFSRKQSASSIWVVSGAMPLTSLGVYMDYSFSEVILKNSMCSIKVWFYKREGFRNFTYSLNS